MTCVFCGSVEAVVVTEADKVCWRTTGGRTPGGGIDDALVEVEFDVGLESDLIAGAVAPNTLA